MSGTVLVTGGSGFIGSYVVDRLIAAGCRPRIFDRRPSPWHENVPAVIGDLLQPGDVAGRFAAAWRSATSVPPPTSARSSHIPHARPNRTQPEPSTSLRLPGVAGITRVVYASTVWVYSDVTAADVDEETLLPPPAHLYTAGKLSGELLCRSYAELYDTEPTIVRFGIPYGPPARPAAVIPQFVDRALRGEPLTIAGTGDQERSFVYVEDLA